MNFVFKETSFLFRETSKSLLNSSGLCLLQLLGTTTNRLTLPDTKSIADPDQPARSPADGDDISPPYEWFFLLRRINRLNINVHVSPETLTINESWVTTYKSSAVPQTKQLPSVVFEIRPAHEKDNLTAEILRECWTYANTHGPADRTA